MCPNHKQELSSVYQFIDVLYNLHWLLSGSGERLMEFYDALVSSVSDVYASPHCTVQHLKYLSYLGNYWLLPNLGNYWLLPVSVTIGHTPR